MSSSDGADPHDFQPAAERPTRNVDSLLLESLIHVLIEKGVLTRNDALSVIGTVAQVKRGEHAAVDDDGATSVQTEALMFLKQLYASFEALNDRPKLAHPLGENVHALRPPLHAGRPEFPGGD